MKLFDWFKQSKIKPTTSIPFKQKGEKFKGFKITLPAFLEWWFKPKDEK